MSTSPGNKPDFFQRREFTFTLAGDIFVRYKCFRDADEFKKAVLADMPERIEIGPVYTATPDKNKVLKKDVFKPVERELIFDLDMNDYDDIRTCCTGANVCKK
jgi:DNA primase small subunit